MGGKDKGKSNKKAEKKTDTNKLTPVDRTFYDLTITDLNQKLARLRTHFQALDEANSNLSERLVELEEDRIDVSAHLERKLAQREDTICELKERLIEVTKVRNAENAEAQEKIRELEARHKAMSDQLTSEIKLLNGKLNSLEEFRVQRDSLLAKFDDQEAELKEKDRAHKETLYNLEQQAIVEKDILKKEVERKLLQVAEDFTRSNEIRNAGYTRRLIRENIALQKELESALRAYFEMKEKYDRNMEHWTKSKTKEDADSEVKQQLIYGNTEKQNIIEALTSHCTVLKAECNDLKRYREKYERLIVCETCERFREVDAAAQKRNLKQRIERLEKDRGQFRLIAQQQALELYRMQDIIEQISATIIAAIDDDGNLLGSMKKGVPLAAVTKGKDTKTVSETTLRQDEALFKKARENLVRALTEIINRGVSGKLTDDEDVKGDIAGHSTALQNYRPGQIGFMQSSPQKSSRTLIELFKREARLVSHTAHMCKPIIVQSEKPQQALFIPKSRAVDSKALLDVEYGPMLYYSLSHEEEDAADMGLDDDSGEGMMGIASQQEMGASSADSGKKGDGLSIDKEPVEDEVDFDINLFY